MAGISRRQPHRDFPDNQDLSARHERAESRQHHHYLLGRRLPVAPRIANPVCCRQRRHRNSYPRPRCPVGPYGIRANCIAPETILTERNKQRIPEAQQGTLINLHPIRRLGTPEDVAGAALYLASDNATWVTGIVLDVAGGAVMV